jgi:aminocarboxymuconate-semialdehyde decarboxylase
VADSPGLIDVHSHLLPAGLPNLAAETGDERWPYLIAGDGEGVVMHGGSVFRRVRASCWDLAARVSDLDRRGVDVQVVSPVPVTLADWAEPDLALRYLTAQNDAIAAAAADSGGRFIGLGAVPLGDTVLAIKEMKRVVGELRLSGIEIGTRVAGWELDAPHLDGFFAAAAEAEVPLFVHPVDGAGISRCEDPFEAFGIGMLSDSALAAKALVFGGVLERHPRLRICLSHGGGAFPYMYPRLRMWATSIGVNGVRMEPQSLDQLVGRLHVDSLVFDPALLGLLVSRYGPDRVMFGSDDPFVAWGAALSALEETPTLSSTGGAVRRQVRCENALAFYSLT